MTFTAQEVWERNGPKWRKARWSRLDQSNPQSKRWLSARYHPGGTFVGLQCRACAQVSKDAGVASPAYVQPYVDGTVTNAIQVSHLRRHANCKFHRRAVRMILQGLTFVKGGEGGGTVAFIRGSSGGSPWAHGRVTL